MTWVRRGRLLVGVLLACLSIPLLGGQAWAGVTQPDPAVGFGVQPTEVQAATYTVVLTSAHTYEALRVYRACSDSVSTNGQFNVTPGTAVTLTPGSLLGDCASGSTHHSITVRGTKVAGATTAGGTDPVALAWRPDSGVVVSPSPSPSPSPVVSIQPGPTHYVYPTPQAGGGDVDSCASDTCTVTLAAGTTVGLSDEQATGLWLFLGTLVLLALTSFLLRHGRALRMHA